MGKVEHHAQLARGARIEVELVRVQDLIVGRRRRVRGELAEPRQTGPHRVRHNRTPLEDELTLLGDVGLHERFPAQPTQNGAVPRRAPGDGVLQ